MELSIQSAVHTLPIFGGVQVSETLITGWMVTGLLLLFGLVVRIKSRKFTMIPGKFQSLLEMLIGFLESLAKEKLHKRGTELVPYCLALGAYIVGSCFVELFGVMPPTADLSMTLALGLASFFMINYMGFKHLGVFGRLKAVGRPFPALAPVKMLTDLATPISLSCRLYGNILAGFIIMELVYHICPLVIPAALSCYFTLFHMAIQAYVFIVLTLSFTGEVLE